MRLKRLMEDHQLDPLIFHTWKSGTEQDNSYTIAKNKLITQVKNERFIDFTFEISNALE